MCYEYRMWKYNTKIKQFFSHSMHFEKIIKKSVTMPKTLEKNIPRSPSVVGEKSMVAFFQKASI